MNNFFLIVIFSLSSLVFLSLASLSLSLGWKIIEKLDRYERCVCVSVCVDDAPPGVDRPSCKLFGTPHTWISLLHDLYFFPLSFDCSKQTGQVPSMAKRSGINEPFGGNAE